jgi:hypothetical protein
VIALYLKTDLVDVIRGLEQVGCVEQIYAVARPIQVARGSIQHFLESDRALDAKLRPGLP